jgi:opacity protein-like surface antigen
MKYPTRAGSRHSAAIVSSMVLLAGPAWAQGGARRGDVEVGMDLGWTGFRSDMVEPNGSRLSVHGTYFVIRGVGLVADITCLGGNERAPSGSPNFTMCTGSVGGSLDLRVRADVVPYVRIGVGQTQLDRGAQAGTFDIEDRSVALLAGAGSRIYLGKRRRVALRADALWTRTGVFARWSTHTSVALGIVYRLAPSRRTTLGGRAVPAVTPSRRQGSLLSGQSAPRNP